ncbi:hypothetical protein DDB_G0272895 [Dictyostelium discoideum AX4]|uniref:Uncharacterized protein n=1 Tax=Dictyostelium discoideum TaxID=44689 RepID=Q556L4_DICDI|nr:hypothetical protein DDB_G0273971 [Dictyostelium discoideum AX4]XP_645070.1 hypothetical protein DDB_G0272895 [Dictyostelium discoideum AX4]EAL70419.1 hypothetical protein DDB_G0273971 [Dictyostelium discoideum AX4]EAL71085.1 hypothetical protein DDB_G0272895 [Dictyostelium discoideum AX4]|eukprot:XP_644344.1 hypothetical protein DDB_G0273971 [Dictyostelium discoideum AX4]
MKQLNVLEKFYLMVNNNPQIDRVISSGLVLILHRYLVDETDTSIQYEASWALTNVASGSSKHTNYIVGNEIHNSVLSKAIAELRHHR